MAQYFLINRTPLGTRKLLPGALIDSAQEDVAAIEAAGGLLITNGDATIAIAAALAQQLSVRGQHRAAEDVMMSAATKSSAGDDLAVDLASVASGKGASRIGVEDAAANFTGATVEAVLAEIIEDYAATTASNGASKVGIQDAATIYTATTVEAALAEVKVIADATKLVAPGMQAAAAGPVVAGTVTIAAGITVAASSEVVPVLTGEVTGSTNFGSFREKKASRVNGAPGVGTVVIEAVGADGAIDVDAAAASGVVRVVILTPQ